MVSRKAVVITGASSGIGQVTTLALARQGWYVFASVRTAAAAEQLLALAGAVGVGAFVEPLLLDVTDQAGIARAVTAVAMTLDTKGLRLAGLINNAGIVVAGPLEEVPVPRMQQILETNVLGPLAITQAFLPLLRQGRGRIILIGSVSGWVAMPFLGPYAASKFALEAIADAWRLELRPWSIPVSLIAPGPVATPIWEKSLAAAMADRVQLSPQSPYTQFVPRVLALLEQSTQQQYAPEVVAATIITALTCRHPRNHYLLTRHPWLFTFFARIIPTHWRDQVLAWHLYRRQGSMER